jgi:hypothetical protein
MRRVLPVLARALVAVACPNRGGENGPPDTHPYPVRDCTTRLAFDDGRTHGRVAVSGSFNGWSETADRLELEEGTTYAVNLDLEPGEYAYKLIVDGSWIFDPSNFRTIFHGGEENSRLIVPACDEPALSIVAFDVDGPAGTARLEVQYIDGSDRAGPDPASLSVRMDRTPLEADFDEENGRLVVILEDLTPRKYALEVRIADAASREAEPIFLPFWIEETPFDWDGAVLYFAFVDRFRNGDPGLDDPVPARAVRHRAGDRRPWDGAGASPVEEGPAAAGQMIASARASAQWVAEGIDKLEAERNLLLENGHRPPEAPPWRGDRAGRRGAPLYLLCEPGGVRKVQRGPGDRASRLSRVARPTFRDSARAIYQAS